jgi:S-adenosylmethionine synthetase
MNYSLFTSESVCAGHPDKICDQISDAIVDAALAADPNSRVACETLVTTDKVVLAGEVTCSKKIEYENIARQKIKELGYTNPVFHFTDTSDVEVYVHQQSPDIAVGVDDGGAGDQGMMFGYACDETEDLMPLPITLAHELAQKMDELHAQYSWLRPDGKSEVSVRYENGVPVSVQNIVIAKPLNYKEITSEEAKRVLYENAILPSLQKHNMKALAIEDVIFNGTGIWEIGGPASDTGVTGRKIIVDTYGGMARIGGGCFFG